MKTYAITIKPQSAFGTPLKGDTIFGHFCWQAVQDNSLLNQGFDYWINLYQKRPFAVFSSAWPEITSGDETVYYLPRPTMPTVFNVNTSRKQRVEQRKSEKKKKWLLLSKDDFGKDIARCKTINDKELFDIHLHLQEKDQQRSLHDLHESQHKPIITTTQAHNTINRLTMATGKGFDPFSMDNFHYLPGLELTIFVGLDPEALDIKALITGLERIGQFGFGRDASTGLGRFTIGQVHPLTWPTLKQEQGCYTLAPSVPDPAIFSEQFAIPFTRFGKHGNQLVLAKKPFKNPIIMADEGAVFFPTRNKQPTRPYLGQGITNISQAEPRTVSQAYSLYLPMSRRSV